MLKYLRRYESISAARMRTLNLILKLNVSLLKVLVVFVKLALVIPRLK